MIDIREYKNEIETKKPIVLNLTNYVVMDFVANALLALGASPIMSEDLSDSSDILKIADSLAINIGTVNDEFRKISLALAKENNKKKPLILDPVGIGASVIRTKVAEELLPFSTILRGNGSEILSFSNKLHVSSGVDSSLNSSDALESAKSLSSSNNIVVSVSGATDYTVNKNSYYKSSYGSSMMSKITGAGCVLTAIIAAFNAVSDDAFLSTATASIFYSVCGETAEKRSKGSLGSFKGHLIDALYKPDYNYIQEKINNIGLEE